MIFTTRIWGLLAVLAVLASDRVAAAADASSGRFPGAPGPDPTALPATPLQALPLVGVKDGIIYLRDPLDIIRLYPQAQFDFDAHGWFGAHVNTLPAADAGVDLAPQVFVRRARLELGGEFLLRTTFDVGVDLVANPAIDGSRVDGNRTVVALANAYGTLEAGRGLRLMAGVFPAPFSLENRSATSDIAMMERNVAIRGFVVPGGPVLGTAIAGSARRQVVEWNAGIFTAESQSPGDFVPYFDAIGRITWRPWNPDDTGTPEWFQIGASARVGTRNPRDADDDAPAITSGQGFAMWRPTRVDALGRTLHIIPSSTQYAAGGEVSLVLPGWGLRGEVYYVSRDTHEAFDNSETAGFPRDGDLHGIGWYFEASWWPLQMWKLIGGAQPELGEYPQPKHLELARVAPQPNVEGLEAAVLVGGVHAGYDATSRGGTADPTAPPSSIEIMQLGLALNFWRTRNVRLSVNGNIYWAPHTGESGNLAVVPGTVPSSLPPDLSAPVFTELGARTTFLF